MMSKTQTTVQSKAPRAVAASSRGGLMQRKCACGGSAGLTGDCEECSGKRLSGLQAKLEVGPPGDRFEQEADRVADDVMRGPAPGPPRERANGLQRRAVTPVGPAPSGSGAAPPVVQQVLDSPGRALDHGTRAFMESRFGHDFGSVRVHTDERAADSARAVGALAYTVGHNVVMAEGRYAPQTSEGRRLLAHELTHVLQQDGGGDAARASAPVQRQTGGRVLQRQPAPHRKATILPLATVKATRKKAHDFVGAPPTAKVCELPNNKRCPAVLPPGKEITIIKGQTGSGWLQIENTGDFTGLGPLETSYVLGVFAKEALKEKPAASAASAATKVDVITGASPVVKAESEEEEKPLSVAEAFAALESLILQEVGQVNAGVGEIGNRSRTFTADIKRVNTIVKWVGKTLGEGRQAVTDAEQLAGAERAAKLEQASARYEAAMIVVQVLYLDVCFLRLADVAENAGVASDNLVYTLRMHSAESAPVLDSVVGFDRQKMAQAAASFTLKIPAAKKHLEEWAKAIGAGAYWSGVTIAALDAITIVYSVYKVGAAVGRGRGGPGMSFQVPVIGGVNAGGAASGVVIRIPSEAIAGIRKLIEIGAIAAPVVALGTGPTVTLPTPAEPSQLLSESLEKRFTPNAGPLKGQQVSYGDPRGKHTRFANHPVAELVQAMRNQPKKGPLAKLAAKKGDKVYGGQLGKEGAAQYEKLVRDALEKGKERAGKFYYEADFEIGVDIITGKATRRYRVDGAPHGAHIIPVDEIPK